MPDPERRTKTAPRKAGSANATQRRPASRRRPASAAEQRTLTRNGVAAVVVAAVLAVGAVIFVLLQSSAATTLYSCHSLLTPAPAVATGPSEPGFPTAFLGDKHVSVGTSIEYAFCPPTSGSHYSAPGRGPIGPSFYAPSSEQAPDGWVHNLEHGSVVLLYRCPTAVPGQGDCPSNDEMRTLQQWFNDAPTDAACGRQALVARFDSMSTRFAVVAWNRALLLDTFDNASLALADTFAERYTDANAPEPGNC